MALALFVSKRLQHAVLALTLIAASQLVAAAQAPRVPAPDGAVIVPLR